MVRAMLHWLHRYAWPLSFVFFVGVLLCLTWFIPQSPVWHSAVSRFLDNHRLFVIALIVSLIIPLLWLLLWKLPQSQVAAVRDRKDRVDLEAKSRQTLAQMVGGAVLLVGLYFTAQTLRTTQEGQITDRFTKAITQLGDNNLAVRLGGIYALERIAKDSESDHWSVMEVLTAFVRERTQGRLAISQSWFSIFFPKDREIAKSPPTDIQAILTILGRRTRTYGNGERQPLNLSGAQLQGANLRETRLQKVNLREAQLQAADLREAQLQEADLVKAQLQGVNLFGTQFQGANLGEARLQGAYLVKAQLQGVNLFGTQLQGADLREAQLQGAYLREAQLQEADLGETQLQGADLRETQNLTQAQIDTACLDEHTQLPAGLTRPPPCPPQP